MIVAIQKNGYSLVLLLLSSLTLTGCKLVRLKEETKTLGLSTVLVGTVSADRPSPGTPIVVAAYSRRGQTRTIVHHTSLHELGPYELMVPQGRYHVVAFADANCNGVYDEGEAAGQYADDDGITVSAGGVVSQVDIAISSRPTRAVDLPMSSAMPAKGHDTFHSTSPGVIADLDSVLFSSEYGRKAFWTPLEFFREVGGNVYFLEPYDPNRIPILFVHGAAGSPQDWRPFFEALDREKFQAWFFYYPSGASLNSMSHLLLWKLLNLQGRYRFSELYVAAHSMGGLVVRSLMVNMGEIVPPVTTFVSISTPWGGEGRAETGVKYSPVVMPVWRDMQPDGPFITSLYDTEMPPTVEHYLLFGHKGSPGLLRPNNDKVVTLASQLDARAQREAKMVHGFDEDHVSILSSAPVLSQFNAIVEGAYEKSRETASVPGNRLRVDFTFDSPYDLRQLPMALLLRSADEKRSETCLYLNPDATGQEHGPFPSGDYEVNLIAPAFVPEPGSIPVTIEAGKVPRIAFSLKPRGSLGGYFVRFDEGKRQAGTYRGPDTAIPVRSITLKGGGLTRRIVPALEEGIIHVDHYLAGTDFAADGFFRFYDLPAGSYELTVEAEEYEPYSVVREVRPGQYQGEMVVELTELTPSRR